MESKEIALRATTKSPGFGSRESLEISYVKRFAAMSEQKPSPEAGEKQPAQIKPCDKAESGFFSRISGSLKGTVTISPGVDLTLPVGSEWNVAE